ncbi:N-acetyltransferase [Nocardiopsis sp. CNT-189]|uniref:GNAT family N-acetyltransferase n=1 Tax=Nocardiopsis oceanisediminis TaxID=2816862 RepID=UPI003B37DB25
MRIRTETPEDVQAVREVTAAAFGSADEAGLVDALRADASWIPGLSLVAEDDDGEIIGHCLYTRASIGDTPAILLTPVSVAPGHQNRGIGGALIRQGLEAAEAMGERFALVLGHPGYYPRFGFEQASAHRVTCTLSAGPGEGAMVMSLDGGPIPAGDMGFSGPMAEAVSAYRPE